MPPCWWPASLSQRSCTIELTISHTLHSTTSLSLHGSRPSAALFAKGSLGWPEASFVYLCTMNSYLFQEISPQCQISHTNQFGMRSQQSKPSQNHAHIYGKVHVPLCKWTHKHEIQISFPASRLTNGEPLMQVELNQRPPVSCVTIADVMVKSMACDEHYDVIKWKHFPRYWPFVRRNHRSLVNSQHKGHSRGVFMFSLTCA